MAESWATWRFRWFMNLHPTYRGTGAWLTYIAANWQEVRLKLPLNWQTRNYVGTIFGGSLYSSVDPVYMIMLIRCLGDDYIVWDKATAIQFKKPGRSTLYAHFKLDDAELERIRQETAQTYSLDCVYNVDLKDTNGVVHASVEKTIYVRRKDAVKPDGVS